MFTTAGETLFVFFGGIFFACFGFWFLWKTGDMRLISRDGVHMACIFLIPSVIFILMTLPAILRLIFG